MKFLFRGSLIMVVWLVGTSDPVLGQEQNYFAKQLGPINWKLIADSVAPNLPAYFFTHDRYDPTYREEVIEWIYTYPKEYDRAKMIDYRLHEYTGWAIKAGTKEKGEGLVGNPPFVYYPVNQHRPVFITTHNHDQDSLVYRMKMQNWYFQNHKTEYQRIYGELPEILPYPPPVSHPDQFEESRGSGYAWYYPEFSNDRDVFQQYQKVAKEQAAKGFNERTK